MYQMCHDVKGCQVLAEISDFQNFSVSAFARLYLHYFFAILGRHGE
jgi:hypothetical protein